MAPTAAVDLGVVHDTLVEALRELGPMQLRDLVEHVSRQTGVGSRQVTAAVWDLIQDDRLRYGSDAYVSLIEL